MITLKLWDNTEKEFETGSPVVILGANGAGKTRLGVKLEELNDKSFATSAKSEQLIHRISAQKSLSIPNDMTLKGLESSERNIYIGGTSSKKNGRFSLNPYTGMLDDYDKVLSYLFSKSSGELETKHRENQANGYITLVQQVESIWNDLLPNRKIDLIGNEVHALCNENRYHGKEMSDGERVVLYMIAQIIVLKADSVVIIDEPELHIHKAIMKKLWNKLESVCKDCLFIYITHDLDFAVSRSNAEIVWVKSFNGIDKWDTEFLGYDDFSDIPSDLVYEMIGTQKKILFIEGTKGSLDYLLYQEIFADEGFHVIPCGGCQEVIRCVKAKNGYSKFDNIKVYGIIDRDFRTEDEINTLQANGIFCLNVAEVENLFIVPELIDFMDSSLVCGGESAKKAKTHIRERYKTLKQDQITKAFIKEIDFHLNNEHLGDAGTTADSVANAIIDKFSKDFISTQLELQEAKFNVEDENLTKILQLLNYKGLSEEISHCFDLKGRSLYKSKVLSILNGSNEGQKTEMIKILKAYIPVIPTA